MQAATVSSVARVRISPMRARRPLWAALHRPRPCPCFCCGLSLSPPLPPAGAPPPVRSHERWLQAELALAAGGRGLRRAVREACSRMRSQWHRVGRPSVPQGEPEQT
eukprot:2274315-Alexandrium_andersonii.AAC.1